MDTSRFLCMTKRPFLSAIYRRRKPALTATIALPAAQRVERAVLA
jgi:hypothetical protein